jgi:hypothetical protein
LERCTKRKKVRVNKVDALYIGEGSVFRPFSYTFNIIDDENIFHPKLVGPLLPIQFKRCVPTIERGLPLQTFGHSIASWTLIILFSEKFEIFNFFFPKD